MALIVLGSALSISSPTHELRAEEPIRSAYYKGRVQLRNLDGSIAPFNQGRIGVLNAEGRMIDSTALASDGSYQFLLTNRPHTIQVLVRGYRFEPSPLRFNPRGPGAIPTITATPILAGNSNTGHRDPAPNGIGSGSPAPVVTGTIIGNLKRHPQSTTRADLSNRHFHIKNATTGQLISTVRTNSAGQFRFSHPVGLRLIVEAKTGSGLSYSPPRLTTTIPRGTAHLDFVYTAGNEVGTADRNLANDRAQIPDVLQPTLRISQSPAAIMQNREIEIVSTPGRAPLAPHFRYTFLVRFDGDRSWRTIANEQRSARIRYTLPESGPFAYRVVVYSAGVALGATENRAFAHPRGR